MANGFLNAVMGGVGGAADATQRQARGYIEDERKLNMETQLGDIQEQRELRLAEAKQRMGRVEKDYDRKAGLENRQREFEQDEANAPTKRARDTADAEAKGRTARKLETETSNDPEYLKGVRKKAQAGHVESASSVASAEAAREATRTAAQLRQLRTQMADAVAAGDTATADRLRNRIDALSYAGGKSAGQDYDIEKTITEPEVDELTGEPTGKMKTRTETTRRRKPDPVRATSSPSPAAAPAPANRPPLDSFFRK